MEVSTQARDGYAVVLMSGDLDSTSGGKLDQALESVEARDPKGVVLDLSRLDFMDSTGLHLITRASERAAKSGRRLAIVRGPEQVQRVFEVTGLDVHLEFVDSPETLATG